MDSLLASYGSDQESEDDEEPQPQPPASFKALDADQGANPLSSKNSLFASLPSPKFPAPSTLPGSSAAPLSSRPIADRNHRLIAAEEELWVSDQAALASAPLAQWESKRSSLFSSLPPPKSAGSSSVASVGPPQARPASDAPKRVVKFTPPVNSALLENREDDEPQRKKRTSETVLSGNVSGLAAILPRPKNLGATLGGGTSGGGRRAILETSSLVPISGTKSVGTVPSLGNSSSSVHVNSAVGTRENYGQYVGEDPQAQVDAYDWNTQASAGQTGYSHGHNHHPNFSPPESVEAVAPEGDLGAPYHQNQGAPVEGASSVDGSRQAIIGNNSSFNADDALASVMMKEKRRGNKEALPSFIEVRQADLTATKVREDQLRTTGIAFGPAYKPVSSNKDKPSKLHRRKHQIGSLYYDMKQKEIDLLERRAKGSLTKSETQAKYGW